MNATYIQLIILCAGFILPVFGQSDIDAVTREHVEECKTIFKTCSIAFSGPMVEHKSLGEVPARGGGKGKRLLYWGSIKVEKIHRGSGELEGVKYVDVIWSVPKFNPGDIVSYPVQVDSDALDGKVTLWSFSDLGGGVEDAPPLILGGFNAMKPSKLYLTVFEELDREDKAQMNSTKTTKDKIKNFP